ncbi:MAG: metallophosphoesterase [Gemmataceae bacterium]|nr:metallophosphoesterase [Gemmataceae bacterium]
MMKRLALSVSALAVVAAALAFSGAERRPTGHLQVEIEQRNPWTHLRFNDDNDTFHFVVVSDRTGGHRARVFSQAVEQINLLQPAFVISVGDLIEGYTKDAARLAEEWKEFQSYTAKLTMPFFYVPGNHDLANPLQVDVWKERFGRRYYHFLYKDVLFLAVSSDDPYEENSGPRISKEQLDYFQRVLAENRAVRWTIVCLHKPMWVHTNLETNGWLEMEKLLAGRPYTVFAGHVHRYQKFVRNGQNYYQLATTGGISKMRGLSYGEFDHIVWVTMGKHGPTLANILLDGIYPEDLKRIVTDEEPHPIYDRKPVYPVRGKVTLDGAAVAGALVAFYSPSADGKSFSRVADALTNGDGTFALSSYTAFDGAPKGKYAVTVVLRQPFFEPSGKPGANRLPAVYADPKTSPLAFEVTAGNNEAIFNLVP